MPLGGKDVQHLTVLDKQADGNLQARPVIPVRFTQLETA